MVAINTPPQSMMSEDLMEVLLAYWLPDAIVPARKSDGETTATGNMKSICAALHVATTTITLTELR